MDVAIELVKVVSRSFYEDKYVVMLDILLRDRIIFDDELAERMQLMVKDIGKIAAKLKEDRLVKSEVKIEKRGYDDRPYNRTFYYLDLSVFADVVKYRLHVMRKTLEDRVKNDVNEKSYYCARCNKSFSVMYASRLFNPETNLFHCEVCSSELQSVDQSMLSSDSKRQSNLVEQTNHILRLLRKIDEIQIPRFDPLEYLKAKESIDLQVSSPKDSFSDMQSEKEVELRIAGSDVKPKELQIEITSGSGASEPAAKHDLPVWHTHSTVTGQQIKSPVSSSVKSGSVTSSSASKEAMDYVKYYEAVQMNPMPAKKAHVERTDSKEESPVPSHDVMVSVNGTMKSIFQVTDEDKSVMSEEEYQKYYEIYMNLENQG